jgi:hypothetical protein
MSVRVRNQPDGSLMVPNADSQTFGTETITPPCSSNAYGSNQVTKNVLLLTNLYCHSQATSMVIVGVHAVLYRRRRPRRRRVNIRYCGYLSSANHDREQNYNQSAPVSLVSVQHAEKTSEQSFVLPLNEATSISDQRRTRIVATLCSLSSQPSSMSVVHVRF